MNEKNLCMKCGEPVGNNVFTVCDDCWGETKSQNPNFYDSIIINLKSEADKLNKKLIKLRENHDYNGYIATLKSLRETLDLINKYDWQLHYSEYETDGRKQVSVWEQNHENNIRNHKIWNVDNDKIKDDDETNIRHVSFGGAYVDFYNNNDEIIFESINAPRYSYTSDFMEGGTILSFNISDKDKNYIDKLLNNKDNIAKVVLRTMCDYRTVEEIHNIKTDIKINYDFDDIVYRVKVEILLDGNGIIKVGDI